MTDRPWGVERGAGQARHRHQLSVEKAQLRHMTFVRLSRRTFAAAPLPNKAITDCIRLHVRGRAQTSIKGHIARQREAGWQCAVAIRVEKKQLLD